MRVLGLRVRTIGRRQAGARDSISVRADVDCLLQSFTEVKHKAWFFVAYLLVKEEQRASKARKPSF